MYAILLAAVLFGGNPVTLQQTVATDFAVQYGWYNSEQVAYIPLAASNLQLARQLNQTAKFGQYCNNGVDYAPALNCALSKDVLNRVYIINGGTNVVFTSQPDPYATSYWETEYTPLWEVFWLEWKTRGIQQPLTNESDVLEALGAEELVRMQPTSKIVLNATIVRNNQGHLLPQMMRFGPNSASNRQVQLPAFAVYNRQSNDKTVVNYILATDVSDYDLAVRIGANYAPRIVNSAVFSAEESDCKLEPGGCYNTVYAFVDPSVDNKAFNPTPSGQLPIIDQAPTWPDYYVYGYKTWIPQTNGNYNPVKCWRLFDRFYEDEGGAPVWLPASTLIRHANVVEDYFNKGLISERSVCPPVVTNSPVVRLLKPPI